MGYYSSTNARGLISTKNSTSTPLTGGATFTGSWEDLTSFAAISISGGADVAGTLYADFSEDGTTGGQNYRQVQLSSGLSGSWGIHDLIRVAKYFRIRVINGASAQSAMNVQSILSPQPLIAIATSRAAQTVNDYTDVMNTRLLGDVFLDEAAGRQSDRSVVFKFGRNPDVAAGVEEDIWFGGGSYTGFLTAAASVRIKVGGNAADTAAGAGARSIIVSGLDENWAAAEEEIATAGASASSATTTTFLRVFRAYVADCGTYSATNTGDIVIETTGGAVVASIPATQGQSQLCIYTVPANKTAFIRRLSATVEGSKTSDINFYQRRDADVVSAPYTGKRTIADFAKLTGTAELDLRSYLGPYPEKTDIWAAAVGPTGGGAVSANIDFVLING